MTKQSRRARPQPTEAQKAMIRRSAPGRKSAAHGGGQPMTKKEKLSKAEQDRRAENKERRTARCIMCRGERPPHTYPMHHGCTPYANLDREGKEKRRRNPTYKPYLIGQIDYTPEGVLNG